MPVENITHYWFIFNIYGPLHRNNILLYKSQQDAHVTEFILSNNCSTCFGRYYHPSSGAQTTVTTASGNRCTVSSLYYRVTVTRCCSSVVCAPEDG